MSLAKRIAVVVLMTAFHCSAVERDDSGLGQVLLFPFFTTVNGWDSYLNISRPTSVLRIRVIDGLTGTATSTFAAYLKPGENLRIAMTESQSGSAVFRVAEGSCLLSDSGSWGGSGFDFPLSSQTGMIEVYAVNVDDDPPSSILSKSSCEALAQRWEPGGAWSADSNESIRQNGVDKLISGHVDWVNVELGLSAEVPAIALSNVMAEVPHSSPWSIGPSLLDADPIARLKNGDLVVPPSQQGIDAVALVLSTQEGTITNDVVLDRGVAARTDWIVSFPLRGYKNYGGYEVQIHDTYKFCNEFNFGSGDGTFINPLTRLWSYVGGGESSSPFTDIDPAPLVSYSGFLCDAVNLLNFGKGSPIFLHPDDSLQLNVPVGEPPFDFDASSVSLQYRFSDGFSEQNKNNGRPVVAYRVSVFLNGMLSNSGVLANYMFVKPHIVE